MPAYIKKETLKVKGTQFYNVEQSLRLGDLISGKELLLKPEPNNPHDKNAVAVYSRSRNMLGHISRQVAAKYQQLCYKELIHNVCVKSCEPTASKNKFNILIAITHTAFKDQNNSDLPQSCGTYLISLGLGAVYVGSTKNLKRRHNQHLSQLLNGHHSNTVLQNDFKKSEGKNFKFTIVYSASNIFEAEKNEANEITTRLKNGQRLYNKTLDGKGRVPSNSQNHVTISDLNQKHLTRSVSKVLNKNSKPDLQLEKTKLQSPEATPQINPIENIPNQNFEYDLYEGGLKNDQRDGLGKLTFTNGDIYEGEFRKGQITGHGKFTYKNGDTYEGNFVEGRRIGKGKFTRRRF